MALLLALTMFHPLIDGFHNRDLRALVADLSGVTKDEYTAAQMTYDPRRLRLKGLNFRPPKTHRYFVTPYGWKVARLLSRREARVFRPAVAMFTLERWYEKTGLLDAACSKLLPRLKTHSNLGASKETSQ